MMSRILPLCFAVLTLAVLASQPVLAADEETHEGMVVKAGGAKLTMTVKNKEHTHTVAKDAKITLDGKAVKLEDLKQSLLEMDVVLEIKLNPNLHDREIRLDNGWVVKIGRGAHWP